MTDSIRLVASLDEAREAVAGFDAAVAASPDLAARLAYHRAWHAVKGDAGWSYAPSRWAGHHGLDAQSYLGADLDGRRTDAVLGAWFAPVGEGRRHDKHLRRLREMFLRHGAGQEPNAKARFLEVAAPEALGSDKAARVQEEARLVALIEAVFQGLSVPAQAALRKRIGG